MLPAEPTDIVFANVVISPLVKVSVPVIVIPWSPRVTPAARLIVRFVIEGEAVNSPLGKVNDVAFVPKLSEEPTDVLIVPTVFVIDPFIVRVLEPKLKTPLDAIFKVNTPFTSREPDNVLIPVPDKVKLLIIAGNPVVFCEAPLNS